VRFIGIDTALKDAGKNAGMFISTSAPILDLKKPTHGAQQSSKQLDRPDTCEFKKQLPQSG
jgi:hypothetical protein